jgi:hypothetical protein
MSRGCSGPPGHCDDGCGAVQRTCGLRVRVAPAAGINTGPGGFLHTMAIKGDEGLSCGFSNLLSMAWAVLNGGVAASTPHSALGCRSQILAPLPTFRPRSTVLRL